MVDKVQLLRVALENLLNGDRTEAAYTLRTLADEVEEYGGPTYHEIQQVFAFFADEDGDYRDYKDEEDEESYSPFDDEY